MRIIPSSYFFAIIMRSARLAVGTVGALIVSAACMPAATAQSYPTQPVKIMVQQGPGGSLDIALRILGESLSPILGQPVLVMKSRAPAD